MSAHISGCKNVSARNFGCDDRECRVLLHEGVRIGEHTACSLGDPDGVDLDGVDPDGSLHLAHADGLPCDVPPSLDISHPALDAG